MRFGKPILRGLLMGIAIGLALDVSWLFAFVIFSLYWTGHGHLMTEYIELVGNGMIWIILGASIIISTYLSLRSQDP